jgi:hypothetical protein
MNETNSSKRSELFRNAIVFQVKLMADGFRDLVLIPVSFFAAIIGLLRGGDEPEKEFNQVIDIGRESERWINLFGNHDVPENSNMATSIDVVFTKVEDVLKQQYKADGTSKSAQAEIDEALQIAHQKARKSE